MAEAANNPDLSAAERPGALYRILWRWHFYAGLFCIPFVIVLAISGSLYLFRPQIEDVIDRDYLSLARTGSPAAQGDVVAAAIAAVPESKLSSIVLLEHPDQAARVVVAAHGERTRVYVHPDTLQILKTIPEDAMFDRVLARIHSDLLLGETGTIFVELAASWAIVMILTGLYLWWPRQARGLGGLLYPRIGQGAKRFWRDLHAVTGVWVSTLALFLLVTGLPWAMVWGNGFKMVRQWTGTAAASQDWIVSRSQEHAEHQHQDMAATAPPPADMDAVVSGAAALRLAPPVMLSPPSKGEEVWWAKSNAQNRPARQDVALTETGEIAVRRTFEQKHVIDQIVGYTTAAHEGQLFGPLNQALGVIAAGGLVLLCVSAFVMWRRRAPAEGLGAPPPIPDARIGMGLAVIIVGAAILLPVLGASLLVLAILERGLLARWPAARRWLGLTPA